MRVKRRCHIQIWRASPSDVDPAQWRELTNLLDLTERTQAFKFRQEADRNAYVLAHGLRRMALAAMLDVAPTSLIFKYDENGKPQLIKPAYQRIHFSHSHTRRGVVFAASADVVVGVDAESVGAEPLDFALLNPFVDCPASALANKKHSPTSTFYRYWTALEAVFKAVGSGLSTANPRLRFVPDSQGHWTVEFEAPHAPDIAALVSRAVVIPITSPVGCVASLAIIRPTENPFANSMLEPFGEESTLVIHEKELSVHVELSGYS